MIKPADNETTVCDLPATLARLGGNRGLLRELIDIYLEDYEALIDRIEVADDVSDSISLANSVYKLKGLAARFGAVLVMEAANTVTKSLRSDTGEVPAQEIVDLSAAADELAEHLRALVETREPTPESDA